MTAENSQRALARPHFSSGVHWPLGCPLGLFIGRSPVRTFHRAVARQDVSSGGSTPARNSHRSHDRSKIPAGVKFIFHRPLRCLVGRPTAQISERAFPSPLGYLSGHTTAQMSQRAKGGARREKKKFLAGLRRLSFLIGPPAFVLPPDRKSQRAFDR